MTSPFAGDARLERITAFPMHFPDTTVFGDGRMVKLRFPPRVNGQNWSDGDGHADLFLFFDEVTGLPVPDQLPVLEAVPKGAAPGVSDLVARRFSAAWEVTAVTVASNYVATDPLTRIDSLEKVFSSPFVRHIHTTNMFLNCPVLPAGSTVDPGSPPLEVAWFRGTEVTLAPYDVEDGPPHPQVMFKFEDPAGRTLPSDTAPHLVLSHIPGEPFYSSIWEVWTVTVPNGFPVTSLRSRDDVQNANLPIRSANIRLDCPAVAVEDAPGAGTLTPMHFEDAFALLRSDFRNGVGRFTPSFRLDLAEGTTLAIVRDPQGQPVGHQVVPAPFAPARTFRVTFITLFPEPIFEPLFGLGLDYPQVAAGVNFVPLILQQPFPLTPPAQWPRAASPDNAGGILRFTQRDLDDAYRNNLPPRLPEPIERNIAGFIQNGLMDPMWAPGVMPYVQRLALVGHALHELTWAPEQGAKSIDTTSCVACHSLPGPGGASRGLYTLQDRDPVHGTLRDTLNGGSMWGSGASELLVAELRARGEPVTFAHGSTGDRDSIRHFVGKAQNAHLGVQSAETIVEQTGASIGAAAAMDGDGDGVVGEATVGEVTAQAAFLLALPPPTSADALALRTLGLSAVDVFAGRHAFRTPIARGGAGCAACHVPFHRLQNTVFLLRNPETTSVLSVPVGSHLADQEDVDDGLALFVGDQGLRTFGDFRLHKMGSLMKSRGTNGTDVIKTAELWDAGSTAPLRRDGGTADLRAAILAHAGVSLAATIDAAPQSRVVESRMRYTVTIRNQTLEPFVGTAAEPLRLVLTAPFGPADAWVENPTGAAPDGTAREGSYWTIAKTIPPGGKITLPITVRQRGRTQPQLAFVLQDHAGWSEAAAAAHAFTRLPATTQQRIVDFLRAQLIGNAVGE